MPEDATVAVYIYASDPVLHAGITSLAGGIPGLQLVEADQLDLAQVAVVAADRLDSTAVRAVHALQSDGCPRVVVVVTDVDDQSLMEAVEAGASSVLSRTRVTREVLVSALSAAAAGEGAMPMDMAGRLLRQARAVDSPHELTLSEREHDVLELLAEGLDTTEVAQKLSWSERTVKNVVQAVTLRLQLRNRTHAVAYALRHGLI